MNQPIQWRQIGATTWNDGVLVDGLSGNLAVQIQTQPATYLTMDRDGQTRTTATSIGPWEGNFKLGTDAPVLRIRPKVVTYAIEIHEA